MPKEIAPSRRVCVLIKHQLGNFLILDNQILRIPVDSTVPQFAKHWRKFVFENPSKFHITIHKIARPADFAWKVTDVDGNLIQKSANWIETPLVSEEQNQLRVFA